MGDAPVDNALTAVMGSEDISRAIKRIAHEIIERNDDLSALTIAGIQTRGAYLADRLASRIEEFTGLEVDSEHLDVTSFRDDRGTVGRAGDDQELRLEVGGRDVVIVDDVIYTGRTVRAALDAITSLGRPSGTQLAVLVDRGHREMPVRPDYVGKNLPTSHNQRVSVRLVETDGQDSVWLEQKAVL